MSETLGERLKRLRHDAGYTIAKASERSGISRTFICELENAKDNAQNPSVDTLTKLAEAYAVTLMQVLALPTPGERVEPSASLIEFRIWMNRYAEPLSDEDVQELARIRLRGQQPRGRDDWYDLYRVLTRPPSRAKRQNP